MLFNICQLQLKTAAERDLDVSFDSQGENSDFIAHWSSKTYQR